MNSGYYKFEQIVEDVRTETGAKVLFNRYNEIRQLIIRAEREINPYSGFMIKKKVLLFNGNGIFNGSSIKKPDDFIAIDKLGTCEDGLSENSYFETDSHIVICDKGQSTDFIIYTYWAMNYDSNGNPISTNNHAEAVVAFIVWKMYCSKVFMGIGNLQAKRDYKLEFETKSDEARGSDFMTVNMNEIYMTNAMSSYDMYLKSRTDVCLCSSSCMPYEKETPNQIQNVSNVYFWQILNPAHTILNVIPLVNQIYINSKPFELFSIFEQGYKVNLIEFGKLCFIIQISNLTNYEITDSLNNDITDIFETFYIEELKAMLFVSKMPYSYSVIYFKFKMVSTGLSNNNPVVVPVVALRKHNNKFNQKFN